jgi:Leucine-rich repeat (LRR) protein
LRNSLAFLDLSKCSRLAHLPKNFGELKALKTLDLSDCDSLITLPDAIGGLGALSTLVVQNCRGLEVLPDAIGELRKLIRCSLIDYYIPFESGTVKMPVIPIIAR